jgi:serine acetyltransferase
VVSVGQAVMNDVFQDWARNAGDKKAQLILLAFRSTARINRTNSPVARALARPATLGYRVIVDWVLGVEIPWHTSIGSGLRLQHANGIVINGSVRLGSGVSLHQGVTLGGRLGGHDCPTIADHVSVGANAIVIGAVTVGNNAKIGAGAVVLQDVPPHSSAVGNPARVIM